MRNLTKTLLILILILSFSVRIWNLTLVPPSLYWDEMDAGYQAYSILKTGKDYFGNLPGLTVQSFADYRAPLFIYSLVPFVGTLGLNAFSIRFPALIFGVLNVFLIYLLGKILFKSEKIGLLAALLAAFAPWNIQYSRMAFETTLMLSLILGGLVSFFRGLKNSKFWILSGLLLGLSILTYNTAKLFVPLVWILLVLIYLEKSKFSKNFWIGCGILGLIFLISLYSSIFQGGGKRFSEISILTDPQMASSIDHSRSESALSYTQSEDVGQQARLIDQVFYNKFAFVLDRATQNYLKAFSPEFLFISGDPNLRHSPEGIGEFYRIEFIPLLFGLGFLLLGLKSNKNSLFLLGWLILAPLPAAITRDGGFHASRLALLFPVLNLVCAVGLSYIWLILPKRINFAVFGVLSLTWVFSAGFFLNHYFGAYKIESSKFFQYGFSEAVLKGLAQTEAQDYVIIDDRGDSALMNYLFDTNYDPAVFQGQIKVLPFEISGMKSSKLGKLVFMDPGIRDWANIFAKNLIDKNFILVVSASQFEEQTIEKVPEKLTRNQRLLDVIFYQNGDVAFYVIESRKPESI